jgi:DNA ligase (NAD+)
MKGVVGDLRIDWSGGVRGEVLMFHDAHRSKYQDKANCRNAANGLMRRKDGQGCEDLTLIVYDASVPGNDTFFESELEKIDWLRARGFFVSETKEFFDAKDVVKYRGEVAARRDKLDFDIDGLVVKDPRTDMIDLRRNRPERQIAFKFDLEKAVSILREVEWSESGATYTPIGIVDPVRLAGTTVKRANLCNPAMIRNLGLRIGSAVTIVKRGEIIPKIEGLAGNGEINGENPDAPPFAAIELPGVCGTCGTALVDAGTRLYCPNNACPKRLLHRLEKWVAVLDIREAGEKILFQLFEKGRIKSVADFYTLEASELAAFERMGELSASKLIRNIQSKRALSLAAFVAGFDIEGVGETIMDKVADSGFDTLEKLRGACAEELTLVYGLGPITAQAIVDGLIETKDDMDAVLGAGFISIAACDTEHLPLKGVSFCFTGELNTMKRSEAEAVVKAKGGMVKPQVVKGLSYLVTNDRESGSAKNKKAAGLGVKIIDEQEFLTLTG